jgi:predicted  nucleic acid-binding Zn-ribbon protein
MEHQENTTPAPEPVKKQSSRVWQYASANSEQKRKSKSKIMAKTEAEDLNLHVQLCTERYNALEEKIHAVESRIAKIESAVSDLKVQTASGFAEIRLLLERQNSNKQVQLIATFGVIVTAILSFIGYLIVKL